MFCFQTAISLTVAFLPSILSTLNVISLSVLPAPSFFIAQPPAPPGSWQSTLSNTLDTIQSAMPADDGSQFLADNNAQFQTDQTTMRPGPHPLAHAHGPGHGAPGQDTRTIDQSTVCLSWILVNENSQASCGNMDVSCQMHHVCNR